jgi:cytochrome c-type biogenesis protein CcmH
MIAAENGEYGLAIEKWQSLLSQLDPASSGAERVSEQIRLAQANLAQAPAGVVEPKLAESEIPKPQVVEPQVPSVAASIAETGISISITIADEFTNSASGNAALFVFIHPAGGAGMPLAVKRLAPRGFPISLNLSDADLLRPGGSLQDFEQLDIVARISMGGIANTASGDIQASKATLDTKAVKPIALHLDQRVP